MRGRVRFAFTVASEPDASRPGCHRRPPETARNPAMWPGGRSLVLDPNPMLRSDRNVRSLARTDAAMAACEPTRQVLCRPTSQGDAPLASDLTHETVCPEAAPGD